MASDRWAQLHARLAALQSAVASTGTTAEQETAVVSHIDFVLSAAISHVLSKNGSGSGGGVGAGGGVVVVAPAPAAVVVSAAVEPVGKPETKTVAKGSAAAAPPPPASPATTAPAPPLNVSSSITPPSAAVPPSPSESFGRRAITPHTSDRAVWAELGHRIGLLRAAGQDARTLYRSIDADRDGRITATEMASGLEALIPGMKLTTERLQRLIDDADVNKNGTHVNGGGPAHQR
jgi:hypothetical protein